MVTRLRDLATQSPSSQLYTHTTQSEAASTSSQDLTEQNDGHGAQDWLSYSAPNGDFTHHQTKMSDQEEDPLVMSTRELARTVAHRVEGNEILETSRRQLEADIYESKRLLQEQMQFSTRVRPKIQLDGDSLVGGQAQEISGADASLIEELQALTAELKATQSALYAERDMVAKYTDEIAVQTKVAAQENDQRKFLELQMEELKQLHMGEHRKMADKLSLLMGQLETSRSEAEEQQQLQHKELLSERVHIETLSTQISELQEQLEKERQSKDAIILQLREQANTLLADKTRLEGECATYEEHKRKVEDHRRQYERAGTDILKLLNDANQKVIILEEHKWQLEDKVAEQKAYYENEKQTFSHCRAQLESELVKLKQQFADQLQQQQSRYELELEQQQHQFQKIQAEQEKTFENQKYQLNGALDTLRSDLESLRAQAAVLSNELVNNKKAHSEEQQQWREEKMLLTNAKNELEASVCIIEQSRNNLQAELEENRRKFEGLKSLLA